MRFAIAIYFLFVLLSGVRAQGLTKRVYTPDDGLTQLETKGMFILPDSQVVVMQIDGTCTYFDGYNFYPTENNLGLPKGFTHSNLRSSELTIVDISQGGGKSALYAIERGDKQFKKVAEREYAKNFHISADTLFYLDDREIKYYDKSENRSDFYESLPTFFTKKRNEKEFFVFNRGYENRDLIYCNDSFYKKNADDNYREILPETLIPNLTTVFDKLRELDFNPDRIPLANYAFYFNFYHSYHTNPFIFQIKLEVGANEDRVRYVLFDKKSKIPFALIRGENSHYFPHSTNRYSHFTAWHDGLQRHQNYIRYFDPRLTDAPSSIHTITENGAGEILLGGYGSGWTRWSAGKMEKANDLDRSKMILPGARRTADGNNLFFADGAPISQLYRIIGNQVKALPPTYNSVKNQLKRIPKPNLFSGYYIDTLRNGTIAFGLSQRGFGITKNIKEDSLEVKLISEEQGMHLLNVLHFLQDEEDRVWMGRTSKGMSLYDPVQDTAYTWLRSPEIPNSYGSMSASMDTRGNLWFGSNKGLKFLENPSRIRSDKDPLFDLTRQIELPNGDRSTIFAMIQIDSFLVIGNGSAISFLNIEEFYRQPEEPLIYQLLFGEDIEGGGAEQNTLLFDSKRQLWIGGQEGTLLMDWDNFEFDTIRTTILLRHIKAGSDTLCVDANNAISLPTDNRNCRVRFGPRINPSLMKNIYFDYFLISPAGDTLTAVRYDQEGVFSYDNFAPGDYLLDIIARKHGRVMDKTSLRIEVPMTLSENPWFWGISGLLSVGGIIGFLVFRHRQKQLLTEKELALTRLENEKNNMQIQAIISSFNPHFINNSLHWVQSRYNKDQSMVKLIGRLSENIAVIFGNTRKGKAYHSIDEELLIVRNYIAIQKIRFRDSFLYKEVLPADANILYHDILLMHLQIHVENAVEHGLRNREAGTFVKVIVSETENEILLTIEDDGCGREFARKIGSQGTQTGTEMVRGLIKIFNANNKEGIKQEYDDGIFTDENGKYGTRVRIRYPKVMTYELE